MRRIQYLLLGFLLLALSGCAFYRSQVPVASSYEATFQNKMQAAGHWDVLAEDTAERIMKGLEDREDLLLTPIYLTPPDDRPFSIAFYNLLTSRLVSRGMQVSLDKEADNLDVSYHVYGVQNSKRFQRPPLGSFTVLAGGARVAHALTETSDWLTAGIAVGALADIASGALSSETETEVVITVSMSYNNRFVVHHSSIYYINPSDYQQYVDPNDGGYRITPFGQRPMRVVNQ